MTLRVWLSMVPGSGAAGADGRGPCRRIRHRGCAEEQVGAGAAPPVANAGPQPLDATLQLRSSSGPAGSVEISIAPAAPGTNSLHLYVFNAAGQPGQPLDVQVSLADPATSVGPLTARLLHAGPGHYIAPALTIPGVGTWTLAVTVRLDQFTAAVASTTFPVP